jgi:hypothetical protein
MEDEKKCEVFHFFNSISNTFWLINSNQNLMYFNIQNGFYYITYTIIYPLFLVFDL